MSGASARLPEGLLALVLALDERREVNLGHGDEQRPVGLEGQGVRPAQLVRNSRRMLVAGTPDRVRERLDELATQLEADELMVTSHIHGHEERLHSYQLLADVYGLGRSTGETHVPLG